MSDPDDAGTLLTPTDPPANPPSDPPADPPADPATDPPSDPPVDPPADPPGEGAPETYADFTMPEGVDADAKLLEQAVPIFKELNLTQDQAQKFIDLQAQSNQTSAQAQVDAFNTTVEGWDAAAKADSEIGGDQFTENLGVAKLGLEKIGTPELTSFLRESGAGSHPEMIRAFYKIGKMMAEDNPASGGPAHSQKGRVERMYPKEE